ncbi:MAG: stage III sporulation protein AE [Clostridiales bacterium]|jgi:stage III sporulation protein AE|nr:stage III sporulation protein AE [Clostridiales bacterium]
MNNIVFLTGIIDYVNGLNLEPLSHASGIDAAEMLRLAVSGGENISFSETMSYFMQMLFSEVNDLLFLTRNMLIVALFSALLKVLSKSFSKNEVSEMGFYVNYVIVVALLMMSFSDCAGIMRGLAESVRSVMEASAPVIASVTAAAGGATTAYIFSPLLFGAAGIISDIVSGVLSPIILIAAVLHIANNISEKELLGKLCETVKKFLAWAMGGASVIFMGVLSVQGITAPILDNAAAKGAKFAVSAVPVVGGALSGAVDTVFYWANTTKSGILVVVIIIIVVTCAVPIIKTAAFVIVYKLTAAIIQPIADDRIVSVIDGMSGFASLMLAADVLIAVMVIFLSMVVLG